MTKKYFMIAIGLLIFGVQACKEKETGTDPGTTGTNTSTGKLTDADKAKLYNKIWYPTSAAGGMNFQFKTKDNDLIFNEGLIGSWAWVNKGDTMDIVDWDGGKYKFLMVSIADHQMSFRSSQGGDNYKTLSTYKDTE